MKKKRVLALLVSAVVFVTMSFGMTCTAFAGTNETGQFNKAADPVAIPAAAQAQSNDCVVTLQSGPDDQAVLADDSVPTVPINDALTGIPKSISKVKIIVPSNGYLRLAAVGYSYYNGSPSFYGADVRTKGYSRALYFNEDTERWIAVKKGTYYFTVDPIGDYYGVANSFKKVKESKYGTKRTKAKKIKRNKFQKGLMYTGAQKSHWYKFKNTKKKKVKIYVKTMMSDTGKGGGLKVSFYKGKKRYGTQYITYNNDKIVTSPFYASNTYGGKLKKGTYYVKVEPYNKATGYFQVKWK